MDSAKGVRSLLLGIQVTVLGVILVLASSGSPASIGLLVGVVGFLISLSGQLSATRA